MAGTFSVNVSEARGFVATPADIDSLAVVIGCSSAGSGLSGFYLSAASAIAGVGYGDAVDTMTQIIEQVQPDGPGTKFPVALYTTPGTTTGSYGTVHQAGTGTAVAAAHSATHPFGTYEAYLKIVNGGFVGTAGITLQWSLDNGRSLSATTALGTATFFQIPNSNVRLDFSPTTADLTALNTLLGEMANDYEAHRILTAGGVHGAADNTNALTTTSTPTDTASRVAMANDIRAKYSLHRVLTAGGVHGAPDNTNVVVAPVATDDSTALILALDLKAKYNAHIVDTTGGIHGAADNTNTTTSPDPVAGAFVAGDTVSCRTFAPAPASSDIDAAFTALANSTADFGLVVCEWPMTASLAAHVSTGQAALKAAGKRCTVLARTRLPNFESNETESTWAASVEADYVAFNDSTMCVSATYGLITDAVTGRQYLRSDLAQYAADVVRIARFRLPDVPADRPEANYVLVDSSGTTVGHDEGVRGAVTGLSNDTLGNRFRSSMRFPDPQRREEVFSTVPWVMYASDERIRNLPTRRIANAMERVAVSAGTSDLGADLFFIPADPNVAGSKDRLTAASRAALHGKIFRALTKEFKNDIQNANAAGIDNGLVQVDPVITVSGGNLLTVSVTLAPIVKGYLLNLNVTLAIQE